jgi:hypothetical protein
VNEHDKQRLIGDAKRSLEVLLIHCQPGGPLVDTSPYLTAHVARLGKALVQSLDLLLSDPGPDPPLLQGRFFSPDEQRIWDALGHGPLRGRQLAAILQEKFGGRFSAMLANLVERHILVKSARGYARGQVPRNR